jgi:Phytanoyl-CoA dioxygenase (PhyH)
MIKQLIRMPLTRMILFNRITVYCFFFPLLGISYGFFRLTGRTPTLSYLTYLLLHEATRGRSSEQLRRLLERSGVRLPLGSIDGVLGTGSSLEDELDRAVQALDRDGYYVFRKKLDPALCHQLELFARSSPAVLRPSQPQKPERLVFDEAAPAAPTYHFDEAQLVSVPEIQRLLGDETLICLANRYLRGMPLSDLVAMWWSVSWPGQASTEAAQLFHFDNDRVRFLKIFFYLTHVDTETGPHVFVRGSHRERPDPFYEIRRFSDDEVAAQYPEKEIVEIIGEPGTIVAVDTSGLHKGKPPERLHRLLLQIEFATSLFGQKYNGVVVPKDAQASWRATISKYPEVFQRFREQIESTLHQ